MGHVYYYEYKPDMLQILIFYAALQGSYCTRGAGKMGPGDKVKMEKFKLLDSFNFIKIFHLDLI